jgi:predicted PurR-regulated permease PerM
LARIEIEVPTREQLRGWLLRAVVLLVGLWFLYQVRILWMPLSLGLLIAVVLDPVVDRMEARGWTRTWATAFIFSGFFAFVTGLVAILTPLLIHQFNLLQESLDLFLPDRSPEGLERSLASEAMHPGVRTVLVAGYEGALSKIEGAATFLTDRVMEIAANLIWVVIIPIVAFYSLRDFHLILAKSLLLVPRGSRDIVQAAVAEVAGVFSKFLRGLFVVSILNGFTTWLVLFLLGMPSALLLGVVAGVVYSIPYIGALLTVFLIGVVAFLTGGVQFMLIAVGANLLLHQILFDQIVTPRILGGHVGLHPLLAIIALLVGNLLMGLIGMILAVPIAACLQIAVLAWLPKLRHEIEIPTGADEPVDTVEGRESATKQRHVDQDATDAIHQSVTEAVDELEEMVRRVDLD